MVAYGSGARRATTVILASLLVGIAGCAPLSQGSGASIERGPTRPNILRTAITSDIRRTEALLNEAGWTKGSDGLFRNAGGQTLDVEVTAATPANSFRGRNRGNYSNPENDSLHDSLTAALQERDRDDLLVEIERLVSADVAVGHLYYQVRPAVVASALKGVVGWPYMHNTWEWRFE